jgi:hypothetical protein
VTVHVLDYRRSKIERAFLDFHAEHPEVYDELVRLARELRARGYERFGIATIYEVARWRSMIRTGPGGFKLNNNYRAYYARLIMRRESDLAGIFDTRQLGVPSHVVP